jgi:ATP-dependent protease HslVU (ClpYQ) peptidase subunit
MSAIVGLREGGKIWIGGDSAGVAGLDLTIRGDSKVFRNGEFLFGFTTSFRMGQLLRYSLKPPVQAENQDPVEYMCTTFVDAVRNCLKAGGFARKTNEEETAGDFLVGYRGHLFEVESDYQVSVAADNYEACGCGRAIVRGALYATRSLEPRKRVELALSAAEHHCAGVRGPFVIEILE